MARRKMKKRPPPPGRRAVARRARRMHAVRNVAVDMLVDENPDLLAKILTEALTDFRYQAMYLLPGTTLVLHDTPTVLALHVLVSRSSLRSSGRGA